MPCQANDAMRADRRDQSAARHDTGDDATTASLLDQRDQYIDQLAQLMDINVDPGDHNQVNVFTNSGVQLVGTEASTAHLRRAGLDDAEHAVERRSGQARRRHHHADGRKRQRRSI